MQMTLPAAIHKPTFFQMSDISCKNFDVWMNLKLLLFANITQLWYLCYCQSYAKLGSGYCNFAQILTVHCCYLKKDMPTALAEITSLT